MTRLLKVGSPISGGWWGDVALLVVVAVPTLPIFTVPFVKAVLLEKEDVVVPA